MNEENTNAETEDNQLTTAESMAIAPKLPMPSTTPTPEYHPFVCKQCGKGFDSMNGVRMHHLRVHTPGGGLGYAWKQRTPEQQKERLRQLKNESNRRQREKFYAQGLDSRGRPRPPGWKGREAPTPKGHHPNSHRKWTPERRAKFIKSMKAKAKAKQQSASDDTMIRLAKNDALAQASRINVTFCPRCGCNVEVVRKAIEFADRQ